MSILGQNDSYIKFLLKTYTKDGEETKTVNTYYYAVKKFKSNIYRITVGSKNENDKLLEVLKCVNQK